MLAEIEKKEKEAEELMSRLRNPEAKPAPVEQASEPVATTPVDDGVAPKPLKAKNPEKENDPAYWRHRAELLAGKIDAEVPRFAEENRVLRQRLAELEARPDTTAVAAEAKPVVIPDEIKEKYGEDFIADMLKLVPGQAAPTSNADVEQLKQELAALKAESAKSAMKDFKGELSSKAPQWQDLDTDDAFNDWLDGIDPMSGQQRRYLFNDAVARGDADRAAVFFNGFGGNQSWAGKQPPKPQVPPQEHYMAPAHSKAETPPAAKKYWSSGGIEAFYSDVRKGLVGDEDATRIERDIFMAQREGRLRK